MHAVLTESIVIDWWLLAPEKVVSLEVPNVSSLWLHMNPNALRRREEANTDFLEGSEQPAQMLANFMHRSLWRNELIKEQATRLGWPFIHQPGDKSTRDLVAEALALLELPQVKRPED